MPDLTVRRKNGTATNTTQTISGDSPIEELEQVIEVERLKENLVPEVDIFFVLPKILQILDNKKFEQKQEIKKQQDDEINDEIDLNRLKDEIDANKIPREIEIYFRGQNYIFFLMYSKLNLSQINENFIDFLSTDISS